MAISPNLSHEKPRRARFALLACVAAFALAGSLSATPASAVCGDGILDVGELCDDGNLADGDCCTSACGRPNFCFATDKASITYRDLSDDRKDRIFWKYRRGPTTFEDFGDPTDGTSYAFCMWDDDELVIDSRIEAGGLCQPQRPCWKIKGFEDPSGYKYFNKPSNDTGIQRVFISRQKPPTNAFISLRASGEDIDPVGPIAFDQYFNQTVAVTVQMVRADSPICWESIFTTNKKNDFKRFKAFISP